MFRDLALSRDNMVEYHERIGPVRAAEQRLTVMVLQQSFWPYSLRTGKDAIIPVTVRCGPFLSFNPNGLFSHPMSIDARRA